MSERNVPSLSALPTGSVGATLPAKYCWYYRPPHPAFHYPKTHYFFTSLRTCGQPKCPIPHYRQNGGPGEGTARCLDCKHANSFIFHRPFFNTLDSTNVSFHELPYASHSEDHLFIFRADAASFSTLVFSGLGGLSGHVSGRDKLDGLQSQLPVHF